MQQQWLKQVYSWLQELVLLVFALGAAGIMADQFFEIVAWVGAITALLLSNTRYG